MKNNAIRLVKGKIIQMMRKRELSPVERIQTTMALGCEMVFFSGMDRDEAHKIVDFAFDKLIATYAKEVSDDVVQPEEPPRR